MHSRNSLSLRQKPTTDPCLRGLDAKPRVLALSAVLIHSGGPPSLSTLSSNTSNPLFSPNTTSSPPESLYIPSGSRSHLLLFAFRPPDSTDATNIHHQCLDRTDPRRTPNRILLNNLLEAKYIQHRTAYDLILSSPWITELAPLVGGIRPTTTSSMSGAARLLPTSFDSTSAPSA